MAIVYMSRLGHVCKLLSQIEVEPYLREFASATNCPINQTRLEVRNCHPIFLPPIRCLLKHDLYARAGQRFHADVTFRRVVSQHRIVSLIVPAPASSNLAARRLLPLRLAACNLITQP